MTNGLDMAYPLDAGEGNFAGGLTKREYFAAMAMQGIIANCGTPDYADGLTAELAVAYADRLIEALNK